MVYKYLSLESFKQVYRVTVEPIIPTIFQRTKATCFAYGQTGKLERYEQITDCMTLKVLSLLTMLDLFINKYVWFNLFLRWLCILFSFHFLYLSYLQPI